MANTPLMPKATAVWMVDSTSLTFEQIAEFCGLHVLEVKGIADGDVAQGIRGLDPINSGQITRQEIENGEANPEYKLQIAQSKIIIPKIKTRRSPRYTPLSRRQDRPNAILWLLNNYPTLKISQVIRLVGTTKPTIQAIRDRCHWNSANLRAQDPVTLGLCSQTDLDAETDKLAQPGKETSEVTDPGTGDNTKLLSINKTVYNNDEHETREIDKHIPKQQKTLDIDSVFSKLKNIGDTLTTETE